MQCIRAQAASQGRTRCLPVRDKFVPGSQAQGPVRKAQLHGQCFFVVVVVYSSRKGNNDNSTYLKTENFGKQKKAREQNTHLYWKSLIPTGGQHEPLLGQSASLRLQERFHSRTRMHGSTTLMQMLGPVKLYTKKWSTESKKKMQFIIVDYSFSWYNQNWKWKEST